MAKFRIVRRILHLTTSAAVEQIGSQEPQKPPNPKKIKRELSDEEKVARAAEIDAKLKARMAGVRVDKVVRNDDGAVIRIERVKKAVPNVPRTKRRSRFG